MSRSKAQTTQLVVFGLVAAASVGLLLRQISKSKATTGKDSTKRPDGKKTVDTDKTPIRANRGVPAAPTATSTPKISTNTPVYNEKQIHAKIEELDRQGKMHFKNKEYMEAAQAFSEALALFDDNADMKSAANMLRQKITLLNNRSAMYEKASVPELALDDCVLILNEEPSHSKARTRKIRILEAAGSYKQALLEVCASQLLFLQANRTNLRMGLPVPSPPVPQTKMEEILNAILPEETAAAVAQLEHAEKRLPGSYTILQLLRSYSGYNSWMAAAAKDGSVSSLTKEIEGACDDIAKVDALWKRGRRHVYEREYGKASTDLEEAYTLAEGIKTDLSDETYARLLEWTGMVRHWHYNLGSALECLQSAAELEPDNALLLVKQAGVQLDAGKQDEALELFAAALKIDPESTDALLHRSNLRIMQGKPDQAKVDLERCIQIRPSHVHARLRLASILVPMEQMDAAKKQLDLAQSSDPDSSEVHSYRGELHFAQQEMEDARIAFEKAIELEPSNPTPYVNAAMAILNTPPSSPGQLPDTVKVVALLERAIAVDPQFTAAYIHLGQLKLGTATDLKAARAVIDLYDTALKQCRSPEEIKELCGMRVLAVAQVEAATMLKMETFNMQ